MIPGLPTPSLPLTMPATSGAPSGMQTLSAEGQSAFWESRAAPQIGGAFRSVGVELRLADGKRDHGHVLRVLRVEEVRKSVRGSRVSTIVYPDLRPNTECAELFQGPENCTYSTVCTYTPPHEDACRFFRSALSRVRMQAFIFPDGSAPCYGQSHSNVLEGTVCVMVKKDGEDGNA